MTWHYRIIDFGTHCALHEVYTLEDGKLSWTALAITFVSDPGCESEIVQGLEMALDDARKRPVLRVRNGEVVE